MEEIDIFRAQLMRKDGNQSWGFRLQGGAEVNQPIKISKIATGSPADTTGLKVNDEVTEINGLSTIGLTHAQVLETIRRHTGQTLLMNVERKCYGSISSPTTESKKSTDDLFDSKVIDSNELNGLQTEEIHSTNIELIKPDSKDIASSLKSNQSSAVDEYSETQHPTQNRALMNDNSTSHRLLIDKPRPPQFSAGPQKTPFEFQTVRSRPFVEPVSRRMKTTQTDISSSAQMTSSLPPSIEPIYQTQPTVEIERNFESMPSYYKSHYSTTSVHKPVPTEVPQSRRFRMLQSVMSNDEPGAGAAGLPPPRSATLERMKQEGSFGSSPRVKVLMSQKYNSPLGMYSANNVIETFAIQAETALETLEKQQQPNLPEYHAVYASPMHG